jgi:hypothetical protein
VIGDLISFIRCDVDLNAVKMLRMLCYQPRGLCGVRNLPNGTMQMEFWKW